MSLAVMCIVAAAMIATVGILRWKVDRKLDELQKLADISQRVLVDFPRLRPGWDGYRAEAICAESLEKAGKILARMRVYGCGDWDVAPGSDGSVQYTLRGKDGAWFVADMYDDCYMLSANRVVRGMEYVRGGFRTQDVRQAWQWMYGAARQYGKSKPVRLRPEPEDFEKFEKETNVVIGMIKK